MRRVDLDLSRMSFGQFHLGDDEHELQVVAQAAQVGQQARALLVLRADGDEQLGLQRRADFTARAHVFDAAVGFFAQRADARPLGQQLGVLVGLVEVPVGLGEEADAGVVRALEDLPGLFGREAQEGRHPAQHAVRDVPQRGLRGAAGVALGGAGVEPVFEHVEVESAQVFRAVNLQLGHHGMELVALVVGQDVFLQLRGAGQRVAVDLQQLAQRHRVGFRVEIGRVGQQEAQRVADAAVAVHHAGEDLVVDAQVTRVVGRGRPQADDLGAHLVADLLRRHGVAHRLGHLAALAVDGEAVGQQALVGRTTVDGASGQQRAVEPAAMLVMAFEVEVGLGALVVAGVRVAAVLRVEHVEEGRARIEPHVEDVGGLAVLGGLFGAQPLGRVELGPGLDAALLHQLRGALHQRGRVGVQLARHLVQEEGQRHTPVALAADAPVGPVGDHVAQAGAAVLRVEGGLVDGVERGLAQGLGSLVGGEHALAFVHAHKPLSGGAEDHRRLVAPAVRVAVDDVFGGEQATVLAQGLEHHGRGLPDVLAAEQRQLGFVDTVALNRVEDVVELHAVGHAAVEVVHAIGWRGVHDARAIFGADVLGQVDGADAVVTGVHMGQRVLELQAFELGTSGGGDHLAVIGGEAVTLAGLFNQRLGQHQQAFGRVDQRVAQLGMHVERLVGRDGPRGGGPDHGEGFLAQRRQAEGRSEPFGLGAQEGHVQRLRLLVGVLDLELGQRRAAVEAPVHGLETPVHVAAVHDLLERPDLVGLVAEVHRQVGVGPVAQHAQALEIGALAVDLLGGVGAGLGLHVIAAEVAPEGFFDLVLDGQAVTVPTGDVAGVEAGQLARLDDHVLEHLVDGVPDVDVAVGVRRAVVQHELGRALACGAQLAVEVVLFPLGHPSRLALGQVTPHREGGVGHVQRGTVLRLGHRLRGLTAAFLGILLVLAGLGAVVLAHGDLLGPTAAQACVRLSAPRLPRSWGIRCSNLRSRPLRRRRQAGETWGRPPADGRGRPRQIRSRVVWRPWAWKKPLASAMSLWMAACNASSPS